ncbi:hypothetical protein [Asticcacaulis sp. AC466]|uniref:hypothetical protein n=1 Tax=Asticcacaulis sp. AC466 TaxID=1282362 RepID=UPI00040362CC|nr:hypothetical protein [Asticcacaulis sp. AC466]
MLKHGMWADIEGPGVKDAWRPRSVVEHRKDGQVVPDLFEIDGKLYRGDWTPVDPDSPKIKSVVELSAPPKVKDGMVYFEKFNPKKLFQKKPS